MAALQPLQAGNGSARRFLTLDVFRGLTVCLMIIVNTPGAGAVPYPFLRHANWNGCTLTDLVFPAFLFATGNALPFAMRKWQGIPFRSRLWKVLKRSCLIFLAGYLLTWYTTLHWNAQGRLAFAPFSETRIMAVLQRIALCYCIAAVAALYLSPRRILLLGIGLLLGYWAILLLAGDAGMQYTISGNAVRKLDLLLLGQRHMYHEQGLAFDPEGLLSTLPAAVNVMAGYLAGVFIMEKGSSYEAVARLLLAGIVLLLAGIAWSQVMPLNKKLWTSSYVLYTTGIFILVTGVLLYAIEIRSWRRGLHLFTVFGKNPLFIYVLSNLLVIVLIMHVPGNGPFADWINAALFQRLAPGPAGSLLFALAFTALCWLVGWVMDRRGVYVRL